MEFAYVIYSPLLKTYKCLGGKFVINFEIYCAMFTVVVSSVPAKKQRSWNVKII